jgi:hypothetical protein
LSARDWVTVSPDRKSIWWGLAEAVLLLGALFCTLPYIPSHPMETLPLWPGGAYAVLLFAASRALRWRPLYLIAAGETALFFVFVYASNGVANLLHATSG